MMSDIFVYPKSYYAGENTYGTYMRIPSKAEVVLNIFHTIMEYLSLRGVSLYEELMCPGYNRKDIEKLIERIFNIRKIEEGVFSEEESSVPGALSRGMLALFYLESCLIFRGSKELRHTYNSTVINYLNYASTIQELKQVLGCSFEESPLYVSGNDLQVAILSWRMEIGK